MRVRLLFIVIFCCCLIQSAQSSTRLVPSIYPTIQAALDVAQQHDTILVEPGTYSGPGFGQLVLDSFNITIASAVPGTKATISLSGGKFLSKSFDYGFTTVTLRDLAIEHCDTCIYMAPWSKFLITNCDFRSSYIGIMLANQTFGTIDSCHFRDNQWGIDAKDEPVTTVSNCQFRYNYVALLTEGINWMHVTGCMFAINVWGVAMFYMSHTALERCVFYGNYAGIHIESWFYPEENPIRCNLLWRNDYQFAGEVPNFIGQDGNFSADPLFCDSTVLAGFEVNELSPVLPAYNACNLLIGNARIGCDCCFGLTGNFDQDTHESIDIADLQGYIDYLFFSQAAPLCPLEADVETNGTLDIGDLQVMVDYLFFGSLLPACP